MNKKLLTAFIVACAIAIALKILIELINPLAGIYGDLTYSMSNG